MFFRLQIIIILDKSEVITLESFDNNHSNIGEVKSYIKDGSKAHSC